MWIDSCTWIDMDRSYVDLRKLLEVLNLNQWHFGGDSLTIDSFGVSLVSFWRNKQYMTPPPETTRFAPQNRPFFSPNFRKFNFIFQANDFQGKNWWPQWLPEAEAALDALDGECRACHDGGRPLCSPSNHCLSLQLRCKHLRDATTLWETSED